MTAEPWHHRDIITNGIRMHFVTQGSGPLIVLLHGFPECWYSWRHQIPFLAEHGYTVVAPDLRGYNDTDKPRTGYDISTLTRDIEGLLKGLGQEKAIIVGHDWGGVLAWVFAARYPEMTERLIILNAPHPLAFRRQLRTLRQLRNSWYVFFFQIPWLPEYLLLRNHAREIGRMLRGAAVQKAAFPPEVTAHFQEAMSKPGAMTAALHYYRQAFRHPPSSRSNGGFRVSAPTLLIWGEHDLALGIELTTGLERWVDTLSIRRIPQSGHWVQQEQPDTVNQLMVDFLPSPVDP
jgi:pimeloyl-ACP methyl ester carboxylesterase